MISFPSIVAPAAAPPSPEEMQTRAKIAETAKLFEANIMSSLMQAMFEGVDAGTFGGGHGEQQFKSMLVDAFAKQTVKAGGMGVADQVAREMLKMQGLTETAAHVA
jgi:peptidoglycan hydrolase FlgJ